MFSVTLKINDKISFTASLGFECSPRKGKPRKYGEKLTVETLKKEHLKSETVEKDIRTRVYQAIVWHKNFPELLNVVIIVKTNLKTGRCAKVLLFSDDLTLASEILIAYYSLRFQIEFIFRDAKQQWGTGRFHECERSTGE